MSGAPLLGAFGLCMGVVVVHPALCDTKPPRMTLGEPEVKSGLMTVAAAGGLANVDIATVVPTCFVDKAMVGDGGWKVAVRLIARCSNT